MNDTLSTEYSRKKSTNIYVRIANDEDCTSWKEFVSSFPCAHHAFEWEWRSVISKVFGHKPLYLIAHRDGSSGKNQEQLETTGVMPLYQVNGKIFGRSLISVPYLNAGGWLTKDVETAQVLRNFCSKLHLELQSRYTELRFIEKQPDPTGLIVRMHKVAMEMPLNSDPAAQFAAFSKKLRAQIRRAEKEGVVTEVLDSSSSSAIAAFFAVFARNMRDLGTPCYPRELFSETANQFGERCFFVVSSLANRPIAAGCFIGRGSCIEIPWASSLRDFGKFAPNMAMYWAGIAEAIKRGFSRFDFGRSSPNSGTYRFKEQWGATPTQLHWHYDERGKVPDVNPKGGTFSIATKCWRRLPVEVATRLGRLITPHLP